MYQKSININQSRPFLNENGKPMNDYELIDMVLDTEQKYKETHDSPFPVEPNFMQWIRDAKLHISNGGNISDFKKETIFAPNDMSIHFDK